MIWFDVAVSLLLTLRIALFRPALPRLLDPNNDVWLPDRKNEQQEHLFVGDGGVSEHPPPKSFSGNSMVLQLHIHVMPDSKVRW
jgi:hypothetical protein